MQIFAPGVAAFGAAKYYELIFERERAQDATAAIGTSSGTSVVQTELEVAAGRSSDQGDRTGLCGGTHADAGRPSSANQE